MKRVFISLFVLIMASTAVASHQISVNGDTDPLDGEYVILPSQTLILDIWTDAAIPTDTGSYWALVVDTSAAFIDHTSGVAVVADPGFVIFHEYTAQEVLTILPPSEDGISGMAFDLEPPSTPAGSTLFDQITFHLVSPFGAIIKLYGTEDGTSLYLYDSVYINTPEPMTIGLLGLGALFLRRRK